MDAHQQRYTFLLTAASNVLRQCLYPHYRVYNAQYYYLVVLPKQGDVLFGPNVRLTPLDFEVEYYWQLRFRAERKQGFLREIDLASDLTLERAATIIRLEL